jgi:hypothetical protein
VAASPLFKRHRAQQENSMNQMTHPQGRPARQAKKVRSAAAQSQEQTAFGILYGQLVNSSLGLDPKTFQLQSLPVNWDWKVENRGFISVAQYNYCSVMPQWSAAGAYVSSGVPFDTAYQQFLTSIAATSKDPSKQEAIDQAQQQMTTDSSTLEDTVAQARSAYGSDPSVVNNVPCFTDWLATPAGASYASQISADEQTLASDSAVYNTLLEDVTNPLLTQATTAYNNQDYYTKLDNPQLPNFVPVPNWSTSQSADEWATSILGSGGQTVKIQYSNNDQSYDYGDTWAQGAASLDEDFFSLYVNGSWQRIYEFYTDTQLSVTIECAGMAVIDIIADKWYSGTTQLAKGPYMDGYSEYTDSAGDTYMFGDGGVAPLMKTGMLAVLNPKITCTVSLETYTQHQETWQAAGGVSIGPFSFGGSGGATAINWTTTETTASFTVADTSNLPKIMGCTLAVQPST